MRITDGSVIIKHELRTLQNTLPPHQHQSDFLLARTQRLQKVNRVGHRAAESWRETEKVAVGREEARFIVNRAADQDNGEVGALDAEKGGGEGRGEGSQWREADDVGEDLQVDFEEGEEVSRIYFV